MPNLASLPVLALAAQLAGVDSLPIPAASVAPAPAFFAAAAPTPISRLSLSEVSAKQENAWVAQKAGEADVDLAVGFDPQGNPWLKIRQGSFAKAYPVAGLDAGVDVPLPSGAIRLTHGEKDGFHLTPAGAPEGPGIPISKLTAAFYAACAKITFAPVDYAVMHEDGGLIPASVSLVRRDQDGMYYVNYHTISELSSINWILAIEGVLYGVKLDGGSLVFYSKPISNPAGKTR